LNKGLKIFFIITALIAVLDQGAKALITSGMRLNTINEVIPGLLDIVYFRNTGSAFGLMRGASSIKTLIMTLLTLGAIVFIAFMAHRSRNAFQAVAASLISGGALGNLIDRLMGGSVVDFIDVHIGAYHWPAFNLADSAITTGVIASLILMYSKDRTGLGPPEKE